MESQGDMVDLRAAEVHGDLLNAAVSGRQGEREFMGKDRQITVENNDSLRQKEQTGGPQAGFVGLHNILKITEPTF